MHILFLNIVSQIICSLSLIRLCLEFIRLLTTARYIEIFLELPVTIFINRNTSLIITFLRQSLSVPIIICVSVSVCAELSVSVLSVPLGATVLG